MTHTMEYISQELINIQNQINNNFYTEIINERKKKVIITVFIISWLFVIMILFIFQMSAQYEIYELKKEIEAIYSILK